MDHDEVEYNNYKEEKDEWLPYVKNDVLYTDFFYARYCKAMEEITRFSMKDCLSAPGLGWKCFKSMSDENEEHIHMQWQIFEMVRSLINKRRARL